MVIFYLKTLDVVKRVGSVSNALQILSYIEMAARSTLPVKHCESTMEADSRQVPCG